MYVIISNIYIITQYYFLIKSLGEGDWKQKGAFDCISAAFIFRSKWDQAEWRSSSRSSTAPKKTTGKNKYSVSF